MNYIKITWLPCPWRIYLQRLHLSTAAAAAIVMLEGSHHSTTERRFGKKFMCSPHHPQLIHTKYWNYTLHSSHCKLPVLNIFPFEQTTDHPKCHVHQIPLFCLLLSIFLFCVLIISDHFQRAYCCSRPPHTHTHTLRYQQNVISVVVVVAVTIIWLLCIAILWWYWKRSDDGESESIICWRK